MEVKSPITGSNNVFLEKEIPSEAVVDRYKTEFGIDVSNFFAGIGKIGIYKCLDTGYRFYFPLIVAGDDNFYQQLDKFPWYYMNWKWEHGVAEKFVKRGDRVLEIGCARGAFLEKIKKNGAIVEGLEMNSGALKECRKKGLTVYSDLLEKFSLNRHHQYDTVCSFQVLEHVPNVNDFIRSSLSILKQGGLMIISVPNNDSIACKEQEGTLNMPPHHMGLWSMNSLIKLQEHFDINLDAIYLEPLQQYHLGYADKLIEKKLHDKFSKKIGILHKLVMGPAKRLANLGVSAVSGYIIGHTILVVFKKK